MLNPNWYGQRYPSEADLVSCAESVGASVAVRPLPSAAYIPGIDGTPPVILVPAQNGPLAIMWALAHELGHLRQHGGPGNKLTRSKDEHQANKWAACALIPELRIMQHQNASIDAFMAALSAHYEDLPLYNCPARELAYRIALHRLKALSVKYGDRMV